MICQLNLQEKASTSPYNSEKARYKTTKIKRKANNKAAEAGSHISGLAINAIGVKRFVIRNISGELTIQI